MTAIVSIPRSGFCSFKHGSQRRSDLDRNPFQSLGRDSVHSSHKRLYQSIKIGPGFNPSVGILFIQAPTTLNIQGMMVTVSIPRSGFCSFKRCTTDSTGHKHSYVSIPRSGFCSFKLGSFLMDINLYPQFQSLGRDSVHSSQ